MFKVIPQQRRKRVLSGSRATVPGSSAWQAVHEESVVFTVKMPRGEQACAVDTLGLKIKFLDKNNISQSGDVMVSMTG